jgi:hypothetical protein
MAATSVKATKTDPNEELAMKRKTAREEAVRKHVKDNSQFGSRATRISVSNVFGDAYRVNYFAPQSGAEVDAVKTFTIVGSEFIRMKVELPKIIEAE